MSAVAVKTEGLGKRYRIGSTRPAYGRLTESIADLGRGIVGRRRAHDAEGGVLWALRDVSLEVERGEVVGFVGRNGAGKTTLLKLLAGIAEPTEGWAGVNGRVASLLEVGTGFHPELTGRENIFLNGAILGMTRREIRRSFDEIVDFAEVERFLDTPVKRYSSGMYVRLAFAVAAHLEPEILIVDEVLAVGDIAFQQKCLGKMSDVAREGLTVLFVSHNMALVSSLCKRSCWLDAGRIVLDGPTEEVARRYQEAHLSHEEMPLAQRVDRTGSGATRITAVSIERADGASGPIDSTSRLKVTVTYDGDAPLAYARLLVGVYDYRDIGIFLLDSQATGTLGNHLPASGALTCITDPINVTEGPCYLNISLERRGTLLDYVQHAASFDVAAADPYGSGRVPNRNWMLCLIGQTWALRGENGSA